MRKIVIALALILMTATNGMAQKMEDMTPDNASTYMKGQLGLNASQEMKLKKLNKDYAPLFKGQKCNLSDEQRAAKKKEYKKHVKGILTGDQYSRYKKLPYMDEPKDKKHKGDKHHGNKHGKNHVKDKELQN